MVNPKPPYLLVAMGKAHYTNSGIKRESDLQRQHPFRGVDRKDRLLRFGFRPQVRQVPTYLRRFYGKLKTAPMVRERVPIVRNAGLFRRSSFPWRKLFIGEIVVAYSEERYLTAGRPDLKKMAPFMLIQTQQEYAALGPNIASAWEVGKKLIK